jgi:hypothetical protein
MGFVVDKAALGQVFSKYFGFPCHSSFHHFLHHHNHLGLAQEAYWWLQCRVDPIGLHPPTIPIKKKSCRKGSLCLKLNIADIADVGCLDTLKLFVVDVYILSFLFLCDRFPVRRLFKNGGLRDGLLNIIQVLLLT